MSFLGKFVSAVSDIVEATKHDTEISYLALKEVRIFAREHEISELQFNDGISWEDYSSKLLKIKKLDLENKGISKLPPFLSLFLKESNVESLSLKANVIEEIPWNFRIKDCYKLKELDISHNKISEWPKDFELNSSLKKLDFSYNNINDIPFDLRFNYWLESLNLSNNNFEGSFGYGDSTSFELKYLDISHNQLSRFFIRDIGKLTTLNICNNNITEKLHPDLKKVLEHSNSSFTSNPIFKDPNPYESEDLYKQNAYINHCFKCGSGIHSDKNKQCKTCKFYICGNCGSCFCNN